MGNRCGIRRPSDTVYSMIGTWLQSARISSMIEVGQRREFMRLCLAGIALLCGVAAQCAPPELLLPPAKLDLHGDSLPAGAIRRLGSVRFRHGETVSSIALSPDGKRLAAASDKTIYIWDAALGKRLQLLSGHTSSINRVVWSPAGQWLASAGNDYTVRLWDTKTAKEVRQFKVTQATAHGLAFAPNSALLAVRDD